MRVSILRDDIVISVEALSIICIAYANVDLFRLKSAVHSVMMHTDVPSEMWVDVAMEANEFVDKVHKLYEQSIGAVTKECPIDQTIVVV